MRLAWLAKQLESHFAAETLKGLRQTHHLDMQIHFQIFDCALSADVCELLPNILAPLLRLLRIELFSKGAFLFELLLVPAIEVEAFGGLLVLRAAHSDLRSVWGKLALDLFLALDHGLDQVANLEAGLEVVQRVFLGFEERNLLQVLVPRKDEAHRVVVDALHRDNYFQHEQLQLVEVFPLHLEDLLLVAGADLHNPRGPRPRAQRADRLAADHVVAQLLLVAHDLPEVSFQLGLVNGEEGGEHAFDLLVAVLGEYLFEVLDHFLVLLLLLDRGVRRLDAARDQVVDLLDFGLQVLVDVDLPVDDVVVVREQQLVRGARLNELLQRLGQGEVAHVLELGARDLLLLHDLDVVEGAGLLNELRHLVHEAVLVKLELRGFAVLEGVRRPRQRHEALRVNRRVSPHLINYVS